LVGIYLVLPYIVGVHEAPGTVALRVLDYVGLVPQKAIGRGWIWQLVTYAFFHDDRQVLHLVFNMLTLYFFGREVETLYGPRRFLSLYLLSAVFAGLAYCVGWEAAPLIGASGAVYAIMVTYAFHYPRQRVLFFFLVPLEVWIVVTLLIGIDLTMQIRGD